MDSGTSSTIASISSGNGTGSATVTFNTLAPTTTGMIVLATCTSGVGLDKLTYSTYSYSTTGAIIAVQIHLQQQQHLFPFNGLRLLQHNMHFKI